MTKRIEIYFILYLGLLMAFFGIDSEIEDYKEDQHKILVQVAKNKLKNLVNIQHEHLNKVGDDFQLTFSLNGDFDKDLLKAKLLFKHKKDENDTFSINLNKDQIGGSYSALVKRNDFKTQNETYQVGLVVYDLNAFFSESARDELIQDFGKVDLVDQIINNIYKEKSSRNDTLKVGLTITPDAVLDADFVMKPVQNPLNSIRGLNGKVELFIGGVEDKNSYTLKVDSDQISYRNKLKINKDATGAVITLGALNKNGFVKVTGRRARDGKTATDTIKIKTFTPKWKYQERHPKEAYFNDPIEFDATLDNFDSFDDLKRYSLKIDGLIKKQINNHIFEYSDNLDEKGVISIQLYLDGNKIESMNHRIIIKKPPPPDLKVVEREGNRVKIRITAYGNGNTIESVRFTKGVGGKNKPEIFSGLHGQEYNRVVFLKKFTNDHILMKTTIKANYSGKIVEIKDSKKFYNK